MYPDPPIDNSRDINELMRYEFCRIKDTDPNVTTVEHKVTSLMGIQGVFDEDRPNERSELLKASNEFGVVIFMMGTLIAPVDSDEGYKMLMDTSNFLEVMLDPGNFNMNNGDGETHKEMVQSVLDYLISQIPDTHASSVSELDAEPIASENMDKIYQCLFFLLINLLRRNRNLPHDAALKVFKAIRYYVTDKMTNDGKKKLLRTDAHWVQYKLTNDCTNKVIALLKKKNGEDEEDEEVEESDEEFIADESGEDDEDDEVKLEKAYLLEDKARELFTSTLIMKGKPATETNVLSLLSDLMKNTSREDDEKLKEKVTELFTSISNKKN